MVVEDRTVEDSLETGIYCKLPISSTLLIWSVTAGQAIKWCQRCCELTVPVSGILTVQIYGIMEVSNIQKTLCYCYMHLKWVESYFTGLESKIRAKNLLQVINTVSLILKQFKTKCLKFCFLNLLSSFTHRKTSSLWKCSNKSKLYLREKQHVTDRGLHFMALTSFSWWKMTEKLCSSI